MVDKFFADNVCSAVRFGFCRFVVDSGVLGFKGLLDAITILKVQRCNKGVFSKKDEDLFNLAREKVLEGCLLKEHLSDRSFLADNFEISEDDAFLAKLEGLEKKYDSIVFDLNAFLVFLVRKYHELVRGSNLEGLYIPVRDMLLLAGKDGFSSEVVNEEGGGDVEVVKKDLF